MIKKICVPFLLWFDHGNGSITYSKIQNVSSAVTSFGGVVQWGKASYSELGGFWFKLHSARGWDPTLLWSSWGSSNQTINERKIIRPKRFNSGKVTQSW